MKRFHEKNSVEWREEIHNHGEWVLTRAHEL